MYTIRADGRDLRPLFVSNGNDITPVYSPDGTKLMFVSERDGNREVYLIHPDGTGKVQLTAPWLPGSGHCDDTQPSFSHDGTTVVFTRYRPSIDFESAELMVLTVPARG